MALAVVLGLGSVAAAEGGAAASHAAPDQMIGQGTALAGLPVGEGEGEAAAEPMDEIEELDWGPPPGGGGVSDDQGMQDRSLR